MPEGKFSEISVEAAEAIQDVDSAADGDVPETDSLSDIDLETLEKFEEDVENGTDIDQVSGDYYGTDDQGGTAPSKE